ncbi:MAG: transglycosylase SLT domain-containing protein [Thermodesulfobacteriota bacterium]|nr:transglycosylase SLT domain-containing protein [Thermodesulfobacteriota bacterium]
MSFKTTFLVALLALTFAVPLAVLESRSTVKMSGGLTSENIEPAIKEQVTSASTASSPSVADAVGKKMSRRFSPKRVERKYTPYIKQVARTHGVSPALVKAVIKVESGFNPYAVSSVGAVGLMQVLPETAKRVGVTNPHEPRANIVAGVKYLKTLLVMFENDEVLAVAAYNSGPGKVLKYGGIPPYKQTQIFVSRVMTYYRSYLES